MGFQEGPQEVSESFQGVMVSRVSRAFKALSVGSSDVLKEVQGEFQ